MDSISRDELNKQIELLARRVHVLVEGGQSLSPEQELRRQCDHIEDRIRKLKLECSKLPELPQLDNDSSEQRMVQAQLDVWRAQQPNVTSTSDSVVEARTAREIEKNVQELTATLSIVKNERVAVRKELTREKTLLEESQQIEQALNKKISTLSERDEQMAVIESPSTQLDRRLAEREETCAKLKERMEWFVRQHLPSAGESHKRKKREGTLDTLLTTNQPSVTSYPDLATVIQDLIAKYLDSQHDPYVSTTTIWPPHFQLLVRSGLVQRHPDNPGLVHITAFHH